MTRASACPDIPPHRSDTIERRSDARDRHTARAGGYRTPAAPAMSALFQLWIVEICLLIEEQDVLRFNELRKNLPAISTRTLSRKLTLLLELDLVERISYDQIPPRVEYRLTARGRVLTADLRRVAAHLDHAPQGTFGDTRFSGAPPRLAATSETI